jgi:large subunit ribosomal protein L31
MRFFIYNLPIPFLKKGKTNMKKDIHPKYHKDAKVICACGNTFTTGSILPEIKTELCSACHPFYTGKQKLVDTARRVEKFQAKMVAQKEVAKVRKGKKAKRIAKAKVRAKKEVTVKAEKKSGKK